jgi:hypothetical protein
MTDVPLWLKIAAAVATVVGATVAVLAFVSGGSSPPVPSPSQANQTPIPVITSPGSAPSPKLAVQYHGSITIGQSGLELDALPSPTPPGSANTTFYINGILYIGGNGTVAAWTGSPNPTYGQCRARVGPNGVPNLPVTPGMDLCVLTGGGHTAYLKNISVSSDGLTIMAEATVWNQ